MTDAYTFVKTREHKPAIVPKSAGYQIMRCKGKQGLFGLVAMPIIAGMMMVGQIVSAAENQPVIQVQKIDAHGKIAEYLVLVKRVIERQNKVVPGLRTKVYRADLAGEETGLLYVIVEFPNLRVMAEAVTALREDAEWLRLVNELKEKTGRRIVSSTLLTDVTP